jgi:hypothetical protein
VQKVEKTVDASCFFSGILEISTASQNSGHESTRWRSFPFATSARSSNPKCCWKSAMTAENSRPSEAAGRKPSNEAPADAPAVRDKADEAAKGSAGTGDPGLAIPGEDNIAGAADDAAKGPAGTGDPGLAIPGENNIAGAADETAKGPAGTGDPGRPTPDEDNIAGARCSGDL